MILEFKCKNHKAIKDKIVFTFQAGKHVYHDKDRVVEFPNLKNYKWVKTAAIYGANGSGKSTILGALGYMKAVVLGSAENFPYHVGMLMQNYNKLLGKDEESEYSIQFMKNGYRYFYGFVVRDYQIIAEYLYHFPKGRQAKIFEREGNKITAGYKFKKLLEKYMKMYIHISGDELLLSIIGKRVDSKPINEAYDFFEEDIIIYQTITSDIFGKMSGLNNDPKLLDIVNRLIKSFSVGINKIEFNNRDVVLHYNGYSINLQDESKGVRHLIVLLGLFANAILHNKVLIIDNIETGIHEKLLYALLKLFLYNKYQTEAQLIFTTHSTMFLDMTPLRKDEVWFTEINKETRNLDLYSLVEFKEFVEFQDYRKRYLMGRYGAIPMVNDDMYHIISNKEEIDE